MPQWHILGRPHLNPFTHTQNMSLPLHLRNTCFWIILPNTAKWGSQGICDFGTRKLRTRMWPTWWSLVLESLDTAWDPATSSSMWFKDWNLSISVKKLLYMNSRNFTSESLSWPKDEKFGPIQYLPLNTCQLCFRECLSSCLWLWGERIQRIFIWTATCSINICGPQEAEILAFWQLMILEIKFRFQN